MHSFIRSNLYVALVGIILLCTGCAKRTKTVLPPLKKAHYEAKKEGVTLKLRELDEHELKKINTKGLGSYKIGCMPLNKKNNRHNRGKYIRVLYGTLINESLEPIRFNRRSISLPILPPHKAYRFSNSLMIWGFLSGVCGLAYTAWGIAMLATGPQTGAGICAVGANFVMVSASANSFAYTVLTVLGVEFAILGFALGVRELKNEQNLKYFTQDTMLSDANYEIEPHNTHSWLMVVRSHKYQEEFSISYTRPDATDIVFDVVMPDLNTF